MINDNVKMGEFDPSSPTRTIGACDFICENTTVSSILDNPAIRGIALPMTVTQYHQMGNAGILVGNTELIRGYVFEKMIKSPVHSWIVQRMASWLRDVVPREHYVRQEQPLTLDDSEPEPDLAVVAGNVDLHRNHHPHTALLVIEVSISSLELDREKTRIYAKAGIQEYAIIVPTTESVELFRGADGERYREAVRLDGNGSLEFAGLPGYALPIRDLF